MKKTMWLLLDDRKGSVGQAQGVALAVGDRMNIIEKNLTYNVWAKLPNWLRGKTLLGLDKIRSDSLDSDFPDIVVSISRRTVPVARFIRKKSGNRTKIVQLMYPDGGVGLKEMDLIVVPQHDSLKKQQISNALTILGAPTKIFSSVLSEAKDKWSEIFSNLPRPYTAIIIGGAIKGRPWPLENAVALAERIKQLHNQCGGSLFITTSRRTGEEAQNIIMEKLKGIPAYTYIWGEKKENPLLGFYACADRIIATADSVSMCSEACGTGSPVLLFQSKNWLTKKHLRFAESLISSGLAVDVTDADALDFQPKAVLNEAARIADKIIEIANKD